MQQRESGMGVNRVWQMPSKKNKDVLHYTSFQLSKVFKMINDALNNAMYSYLVRKRLHLRVSQK